MKKIVLILLLAPLFMFSQENNKNQKASFEVLGVCGMCKNRIEKATYKVKGVKYSNWDIPSNKISLIYNSNVVSINEIRNAIARAGHDNGKFLATDEAYNNLHGCCKYPRKEIAENN